MKKGFKEDIWRVRSPLRDGKPDIVPVFDNGCPLYITENQKVNRRINNHSMELRGAWLLTFPEN